MPTAADYRARRKLPSILLIGDGGTGKSRFCASLPSPFILDFDAGLTSCLDIEGWEARTFKDAPNGSAAFNEDDGIYEWGYAFPKFIDFLDETYESVQNKEFPHKFLCPDSLTTLANSSMNYVLRLDGKVSKNAMPVIQNWGQQLRFLETIVEQLASWPVGLCMTAHIKRDDNIATAEGKEYLPLVAGQLSGKIGIYFDEVWYTRSDGEEVTIRTKADAMYKQAKSRHNIPDGTPLNWDAVNEYLKLEA